MFANSTERWREGSQKNRKNQKREKRADWEEEGEVKEGRKRRRKRREKTWTLRYPSRDLHFTATQVTYVDDIEIDIDARIKREIHKKMKKEREGEGERKITDDALRRPTDAVSARVSFSPGGSGGSRKLSTTVSEPTNSGSSGRSRERQLYHRARHSLHRRTRPECVRLRGRACAALEVT